MIQHVIRKDAWPVRDIQGQRGLHSLGCHVAKVWDRPESSTTYGGTGVNLTVWMRKVITHELNADARLFSSI